MTELPSKAELQQLPLRAIVAYAARCARRVQPLYRLPENHPELRRFISAVDMALRIAEDFAIGREIKSATAANVANTARAAANTANGAARAAAIAANAAVNAAGNASRPAFSANAANAANAAAEVATSAADAVGGTNADTYSAVATTTKATVRDYNRLAKLALGKPGAFGEPIDATQSGPLGPLWPDGPPDWYVEGHQWMERVLAETTDHPDPDPEDLNEPTAETNESERLVLKAHVGEFVDPDEAGEALAAFIRALNAYHIASGGSGLEIDDWDIMIRQSERVEV